MPASSSKSSVESGRAGRGQRMIHFLLFFLACVLVFDALVGEKGLLAILEARKEYQRLSTEITRARSGNARLREEARLLREDPATIEAIARRELGLIKPGEMLFIIKDIPPTK